MAVTHIAQSFTAIAEGPGTQTVTLPGPSGGFAAGDLIVLIRTCDRSLSGTDTSGYTQVHTYAEGDNGSTRHMIEWRAWQSGDTSVDVVQNSDGPVETGLFIVIVRGADTSDPVAILGSFSSPVNGYTATAPGLTTPEDGCLVIASTVMDDAFVSGGTHTSATAGWSNVASGAVGSFQNGSQQGVASKEMPTAGPTGDFQMTWDTTSGTDDTGGVQLAIAPAPAGGTDATADPGTGAATGTGSPVTVQTSGNATAATGTGSATGSGHEPSVGVPEVASVFSPLGLGPFDAPTASGNIFDVVATATFTHATADDVTLPLYWTGTGTTFGLRFTPTAAGDWSYTVTSAQAELDGLSGLVSAVADGTAVGFLTTVGDGLWAQQLGDGSVRAIDLPTIMATAHLERFFDDASAQAAGYADLDDAVQTAFIDLALDHGMRGVHIPTVSGRWFNLQSASANDGTTISGTPSDPDPDTLTALENIITRVHAAGLITFFWPWGDDNRNQSPESITGGEGGAAHLRLMRYIAARLSPLPGWYLGYGFDNFEWSSPASFGAVADYYASQTSYLTPHAARSNKITPGSAVDATAEAWAAEGRAFSDIEQQIADNAQALTMLADAKASTPAGFATQSGDRFRVRDATGGGDVNKDWTEAQTVEGLHIAVLVGGVSGIWGNLYNGSSTNQYEGSIPYAAATRTQMATYRTFWDTYLTNVATPRNAIGGAAALDCGTHIVALARNTDSVSLALSELAGEWSGAAVSFVDIRAAYAEVPDAIYPTSDQTVTMPSTSDWLVLIEETSSESATASTGTGAATGSGSAATVSAGSDTAPEAGDASGAGQSVDASADADIGPGAGSASGEGSTADSSADAGASPGSGGASGEGGAPDVATASGTVVTPGAGAATGAGGTPSVEADAIASPGSGNGSGDGSAPSVSTEQILDLEPGRGDASGGGEAPSFSADSSAGPGSGAASGSGAAPIASDGSVQTATPPSRTIILSAQSRTVIAGEAMEDSWPKKHSGDELDYATNWTKRLNGDTITNSTWIVPDGITKDRDSFFGDITTIWLSSGTAGRRYTITNRVTTSGGRVMHEVIPLIVKDE